MSNIKSIKCTNCAAPLDLLGGGRVESITCKYCKSLIDLTNSNYKVLTNFKSVKELHKLPFEVGMRGKVKGIDYTIIGRVTYADVEYPHGEWTDFLLFSPLYGYAYLTYEEGHLLYSKRERKFPNISWSNIPQHSNILINETNFVPFDSYEAKVVYVEGELTWIAKRNDKTSFIDLIQAPYGISVEKSRDEIEYYKAEYLEHDATYEAFAAKKEEEPQEFHALKPFERPYLKSLSIIAYWVMFLIALMALGVSIDGSGKKIKSVSANNQLIQTLEFTPHSNKYLVNLELKAKSAKALNNFNIQIHQNQHLLFSLTPTAAYTFEYENKKVKKRLQIWEKHAKKVRVLLNLDKNKTYKLTISPIDKNINSTLFVTVKEEYSNLSYIKWFFVLSVILWSIYKFISWRYRQKVDNERGIYHDVNFNQNYHNASSIWEKFWSFDFGLGNIFFLIVFGILIMLEYSN